MKQKKKVKRIGQAWKLFLYKPHEISEDQVQAPPLGLWQSQEKYRLGGESTESYPKEKDLGMLLDKKLYMSQQCALEALRTIHILGSIKISMASRTREVIPTLYLALTRPHLEYCGQLWFPQHKMKINSLEQVQRRAKRKSEGWKIPPLKGGKSGWET